MSYTSQQFLISDCASSANFRLWASAISAAMASMGWTQSSDTGQVTDPTGWSTTNVPAAGSWVYQIWKPGDALTAFYLKIEYGTGSGSPNGVRMRMSLSTATNGSGTLTGLVSTVFEPSSATGTTGNGNVLTYDSYFSGDVSRMGMILWRSVGSNGQPFGFFVERTKNTDGTDSSDGVTIAVLANSNSSVSSVYQQTLVFGVAAGNVPTNKSYVLIWNGTNSSGAFNNDIPITPGFPDYGRYGNPMTVLGWVHSQDVAEACFFTTTLYGATRTYLATGQFNTSFPTNGQLKLCMRYD